MAMLFAKFDRSFPEDLPGSAPRIPQTVKREKSAARKPGRPPAAAATVKAEGEYVEEATGGMARVAARARVAAPPQRAAAAAPAGATMLLMDEAMMVRGGSPPPPEPPPPEPKEVEPAGGWLDFDALALHGAE